MFSCDEICKNLQSRKKINQTKQRNQVKLLCKNCFALQINGLVLYDKDHRHERIKSTNPSKEKIEKIQYERERLARAINKDT